METEEVKEVMKIVKKLDDAFDKIEELKKKETVDHEEINRLNDFINTTLSKYRVDVLK